MSQMHLTLANAPRVARAFETIGPAIRAMEADPIKAFANYGDDLIAVAEVIVGPAIHDMPLHEALDAITEALPQALQGITDYLNADLVPSIERMTRLVMAATNPDAPGASAFAAADTGEHQANAQ